MSQPTVPDSEGVWEDAQGITHYVVKALDPWTGYDGSVNEFLIYHTKVDDDNLITVLDAATDAPYTKVRELTADDFA